MDQFEDLADNFNGNWLPQSTNHGDVFFFPSESIELTWEGHPAGFGTVGFLTTGPLSDFHRPMSVSLMSKWENRYSAPNGTRESLSRGTFAEARGLAVGVYVLRDQFRSRCGPDVLYFPIFC